MASQIPGPDFNYGYPFILEMDLEYEITMHTPELLSVLFTGISVFYAGVPDVRSSFRNGRELHGITIDLTRVEKLQLEDFTVIDEELVRKMRESPNITNGPVKEGYIDKNDLKMLFETDIQRFGFGSIIEGLSYKDEFFCVTPNSLIVSILIDTASGHYALIEVPYEHTKYRNRSVNYSK
jgi:hypothetical protein